MVALILPKRSGMENRLVRQNKDEVLRIKVIMAQTVRYDTDFYFKNFVIE